MERRLSAILAADVVGYSRMMANDEEATLARLRALFEQLRHETIAIYRGRVFSTAGDGLLAEFSSAMEAVRCALEIQKLLWSANADAPEDTPLEMRIGVNLGDVMAEDDDIFGDGVNVASRLEGIAVPGGIVVSASIHDQVRGKLDQAFEDLGFRNLKNIPDPVHAYQVTFGGHNSAAAARGLFDFGLEEKAPDLIAGGCLCGRIRYEIDKPAIQSGFCHCRICQRFTGGPVGAWTAFPGGSLRFTQGQPRSFGSSPIAERAFCPDCGTSLTYRLLKPREQRHIVVFTASLDNPQDFAPTLHGGVESRMPWLEIHDDLPRTRTEDSAILREAWASVGKPDPDSWKP
jgi:class 3 adenylate cyclase